MFPIPVTEVYNLCFWRQILSLERIAGTTFQHLRVILNLLKGSSEQLCRCVPGKASDMCFIQNPGGFQPTKRLKSRCI